MRHQWDYSQFGSDPRDMLVHGKRVCKVCGEVQKKHQKQDWMRVIGYQWDDDGRKPCPGPKTKGKKNARNLRADGRTAATIRGRKAKGE